LLALSIEAHSIPSELQVRICSLNADAIRGKLELQLELARINCTVATKEAENAWATLLSNRDNEHHRRQLFFHTVWKIREVVYNLPHSSHGDPPKHSVYDILSMFLGLRWRQQSLLEAVGRTGWSRFEPDFEQARHWEDLEP